MYLVLYSSEIAEAFKMPFHPTGQFYVISDVLTTTTPRNLAPRASESVMNPRLPGSTREEKRRVTHNEVERRRRDKINTWIYRLAKIIPDCPEAHTKNSQVMDNFCLLYLFLLSLYCLTFFPSVYNWVPNSSLLPVYWEYIAWKNSVPLVKDEWCVKLEIVAI